MAKGKQVYPLEGRILSILPPRDEFENDNFVDESTPFTVSVALKDGKVVVVRYEEQSGYDVIERQTLCATLRNLQKYKKGIRFHVAEPLNNSRGAYTGIGLVQVLDKEK